MTAVQEWREFRRGLNHLPTRKGFCDAWRLMTGKEAPESSIAEFGRLVCDMFSRTLPEFEADTWPCVLPNDEENDVLFNELPMAGTIFGWSPEKLKARYPEGWDSARSHSAGEVPAEEVGGESCSR